MQVHPATLTGVGERDRSAVGNRSCGRVGDGGPAWLEGIGQLEQFTLELGQVGAPGIAPVVGGLICAKEWGL